MTIDLNVDNKIYIPLDRRQSSLPEISNLSQAEIAQRYTPIKNIGDWKKRVTKGHWKNGYSAQKTASSWYKSNPDMPEEIKALFGDSAKLLFATPEHQTSLPGRGRGSHSDILAFVCLKSKVYAVAVEGKVKEGFGKTVVKELQGASPGKKARLQCICDKLGLAYPPADEIRYQLLHRTASAIIEAERFNADCAAMIVHSFSDERAGFDDFVKFLKSLGIRSVAPGKLYESTRSDIPLLLGWATP